MILEVAIKQEKFSRLDQKAILNIMYSASWFSSQMRQTLEPFDISWQQFNLLRIVKGQKGKAISLKLITARMIDKTSNTSRLVEKLVKKEFITRVACSEDRRQIDITITDLGLQVVEDASDKMNMETSDILKHMKQTDLQILNDLLDLTRLTEQNVHS